MEIITETIRERTTGDGDIINITDSINHIVRSSHIKNGQVLIFSVGSTSAVTHIEFEPGLKNDLPQILDELIPYSRDWKHHRTWGDHNGASHLKASIIGPSLTVPFINGQLALGTWQQVVLLEFDDRPRNREVIIQVTGE